MRETFFSSLPLAAIMIIVFFFVAPLQDAFDYVKLLIGYAAVVFGQALFLVGLDVSILPVGKTVGESLVKFKKTAFIVFFGFLFGTFAEAAEPALTVFARQTNLVMGEIDVTLFIWVMASGIGVFVGFALWRIIKNFNIKIVFSVLYIVLFTAILFVPPEFIAVAFDGSGATTGDISVPFMLALGIGVSTVMSRRKTNDDTFGIIGIASVGPILAVFIYGIIFRATHGGAIPSTSVYDPGLADNFGHIVVENLGSVALAVLPIVLVFILFQVFFIKLPKKEFFRLLLGFVTVFVGLLVFLSGIDFGFSFTGQYIGKAFLSPSRPEWFKWILLAIGFVLGAAITLSEPAVTVLGKQLEEVTNGHIKKMTIRITLAVGIGVAVILSIVKIFTQISILWFLAPLYVAALCMMRFTSKMFVGLAFDSGGVAGGSLAAAFLTPLTLGVAQAVADSSGFGAQFVLANGFGIIAFLSVTPIIAVQTLGIIFGRRFKKLEEASAEEDVQDLVFLTIIAERRRKDSIIEDLLGMGIHLVNTSYGRGTVTASMLQTTLGLVHQKEKVIITCMATQEKAHLALDLLVDKHEFHKRHTGIAFTMPIDSVSR